ncbi:putative transporter [soil metagenome]
MSEWLATFATAHPVSNALMVLGLVSACGLALGAVQIRGIGLGAAGVLFAGLWFGHLGLTVEPSMLDLMRDFGLVLFVYSIGMKIGVGFLGSLRKQGLTLNLLAVAIVLLGAAITLAAVKWGGIDMAAAAGLFTGGTTNTPALGAAQETLKSVGVVGDRGSMAALGYAVAYPFGIVGIILSMLLLRSVLGIDMRRETLALHSEDEPAALSLERVNVVVENEALVGMTIGDLLRLKEFRVTISRIKSLDDDEPRIAHDASEIRQGDILLAVGPRDELGDFVVQVGRSVSLDLRRVPGRIGYHWVVVTREEVLGKTIDELALQQRFGVGITRMKRLGAEKTAHPGQRLEFGDTLLVVGEEESLQEVEKALGNSKSVLDHLDVLPMFLGITLGILLGQLPISVPGIPTPIRIGIAGGPLLVAIALSHFKNIGRLRWRIPPGASGALRDLGITLFLAAVGLKAGAHFVQTLTHGDGLYWMAWAAVITLVPLLAVGLFARLALKTNFLRLCGLLAGSMTDPPALAFATSISQSDACAVSYATVYPLTMILRILAVQVLVLIYAR